MLRISKLITLAMVCAGLIASPVAAQGFGAIDRARLLAADKAPQNWLTAGRDSGKTHYSPLDAINRETVSRLGFAWDFHTDTQRGLEATPIVVDGIMYTSGVAGRVYALNAATGALLWQFVPDVDYQVTRGTCCDEVNRGVAVWQGRVYVAALDGILYALDAGSGKVLWKADTIVDHGRGYSSTGAPEVAGNVVVIGNAGGEYDARGYISAYDLASGKLRWRFFTVPDASSKADRNPALRLAAKSWDPHSLWKFGGGGTVWDGMVYDPELKLLYVGTGNGEVYPRKLRSPKGGDNLFTCSVLAIDPQNGKLIWYYQETPGDQWDYDADQPIILTTLKIKGVARKVLLHAPKNGVFYVFDRRTGKLISAAKYARANWFKGVNPKAGQVIEDPAADYSSEPKLVFPSTVGAHNWNPMAYDPGTGLVYLSLADMGNVLADASDHPEYRKGLWGTGVVAIFSSQLDAPQSLPPGIRALLTPDHLLKGNPDLSTHGYLEAYDPVQQKIVWRVESAGWWDRAGVLATGGSLVFQGTGTGRFRVYDARDGKLLKDVNVGTSIIAAPMTYSVDGVQYVAVMAGWGGGGWAFPHPESAAYNYGNEGRIIAFKLDGGEVPLPKPLGPPPPLPKPPAQNASAATIQKGMGLFFQNCVVCHSDQTRSGSADLRRMAPEVHEQFNAIVRDGLFKSAGMPAWGDVLSSNDAEAIHSYLIWLANQDYAAQEKNGGKEKAGGGLHGF
ncbi:MAG: PQQ-dependent dehydrogenase, methanol/ethanol family [Alphaproteobacteria bacterium]|nr:PQQ-dependent dehydrogenase, methanol/ethanol family [Alphaproteobacteria bacterium]